MGFKLTLILFNMVCSPTGVFALLIVVHLDKTFFIFHIFADAFKVKSKLNISLHLIADINIIKVGQNVGLKGRDCFYDI